MENNLSEREQKYYLAAFQTCKTESLCTNNGISLFQFADVHCKTTGDSGKLHEQWCHEITFVYSGHGEIIHNGIKIPVKSGQIHLCPKGTFHQVLPTKTSPMRFFCMGFMLEKNNDLYSMLQSVFHKLNENQSPVLSDCADLLSAFEASLKALCGKDRSREDIAIAVNSVNYIITAVCNRFLTNRESISNISPQESLLFYVIGYLKDNVYNINALKNLPDHMGYSYPYLSHLFSEKMGQSLKSFFTALRMNMATELLKKKKVTEVSDMLGYSSMHAFSRAYKQFCSESPSTAKEKLNEMDLLKYI